MTQRFAAACVGLALLVGACTSQEPDDPRLQSPEEAAAQDNALASQPTPPDVQIPASATQDRVATRRTGASGIAAAPTNRGILALDGDCITITVGQTDYALAFIDATAQQLYEVDGALIDYGPAEPQRTPPGLVTLAGDVTSTADEIVWERRPSAACPDRVLVTAGIAPIGRPAGR